MLNLNPTEVRDNGLVNAISSKSASYIAELVPAIDDAIFPPRIKYLENIVVHTDPHIDEYFASLIFRALCKQARNIPFKEQSLYSYNDDIYANTTWDNAVVFGIGALYKKRGGIDPLLSYDEHVAQGQKKRFSSCADMILHLCFPRRSLLDVFDTPLQRLYGEVDHIDNDANAHPQNISDVAKDLHSAEYLLKRGLKPSEDIREVMNPSWKRMILDSIFAAVAYCLKENVFPYNNNEMSQSIKWMYEYYLSKTLLTGEPDFDTVSSRLKSNLYNVTRTVAEATLKVRNADGKIEQRLDSKGHPIPQRMILPKISVCVERCWGRPLGSLIMSNLFETMILSQLSYQKAYRAIEGCIAASSGRDYSGMTEVGWVEFKSIETQKHKDLGRPLWLISLSAKNGLVRPNRALTKILKDKNDGYGIIMIQNSSIATKVLFRGAEFPYDKWQNIVEALISYEGDADDENIPGCWHKTVNHLGVVAPFLLNGNNAHRYIPRSKLNVDSLKTIMDRI